MNVVISTLSVVMESASASLVTMTTGATPAVRVSIFAVLSSFILFSQNTIKSSKITKKTEIISHFK